MVRTLLAAYSDRTFRPAERAARRPRRLLSVNPVTLLPGGPTIEAEAARRIALGGPLAFLLIDIDNFRAYNENYGYLKGDRVIKSMAALLLSVAESLGGEDIFVGHAGGDDFVLMGEPAMAERAAEAIVSGFDRMSPDFYSEEDRKRSFLMAPDRAGRPRRFPLMTLSVAIAANDRRRLGHYAKIAEIVCEIRRYLKALPGRLGSLYLKDRRSE